VRRRADLLRVRPRAGARQTRDNSDSISSRWSCRHETTLSRLGTLTAPSQVMIGPKPRASHHGNAGENFQESDGLSSNGLPPQRFKIGPRVNNPPKCGIGTPHICRGAVASRCPRRYGGGNSECPRPVLQQSACGWQRCGRSRSAGGTAKLTGSIRHVAQLKIKCTTVPDAQERVAAHVRRLEALRRAGIVERLAECRSGRGSPLRPPPT
jgi:hypothetical protein